MVSDTLWMRAVYPVDYFPVAGRKIKREMFWELVPIAVPVVRDLPAAMSKPGQAPNLFALEDGFYEPAWPGGMGTTAFSDWMRTGQFEVDGRVQHPAMAARMRRNDLARHGTPSTGAFEIRECREIRARSIVQCHRESGLAFAGGVAADLVVHDGKVYARSSDVPCVRVHGDNQSITITRQTPHYVGAAGDWRFFRVDDEAGIREFTEVLLANARGHLDVHDMRINYRAAWEPAGEAIERTDAWWAIGAGQSIAQAFLRDLGGLADCLDDDVLQAVMRLHSAVREWRGKLPVGDVAVTAAMPVVDAVRNLDGLVRDDARIAVKKLAQRTAFVVAELDRRPVAAPAMNQDDEAAMTGLGL